MTYLTLTLTQKSMNSLRSEDVITSYLHLIDNLLNHQGCKHLGPTNIMTYIDPNNTQRQPYHCDLIFISGFMTEAHII